MARYNRDEYGTLYDEKGNVINTYETRHINPTSEALNPPDQLAFDENGVVLQPPDVVEDNQIVEEEIQNSIDILKRFDVIEFFNAFEENTERTLKALLTLQSNTNPLKKGGDGVAFMADALFLATMEMFDNAESIVFDILCAKVSSRPEDNIYRISISDALPYLDYSYKNKAPNNSYKKKLLQLGTESISKKNALSFQIPNTNKSFDKPWHDGLLYTKVEESNIIDVNADDDEFEEDYIYFKPTPLFKVLADSSTIMHGSHYSLKVGSQLSGLIKRFFIWLEGKKNYKEYPTAQAGVFTVGVSDLKSLFKLPDKYKPADVKRRLLDEAKLKFATVEGLDFTFDYEDVKKGNKIVAFKLTIYNTYNKVAIEVKKNVDEDFYNILSIFGYSDKDIEDLFESYKKYKRNIDFLKKAIAKMELIPDIKNRNTYLKKIFEKGLTVNPPQLEKKNSTEENFGNRPNAKDFYSEENMYKNGMLN